MDDITGIVNLFFEAGILKETPRSGWARVGVEHAESVSSHSYRTMIIGYALAEMEGVDPQRVACMLLFHDLHEARLGDLSWLHRYYVGTKDVNMRVVKDQAKRMPKKMGEEYQSLYQEYDEQETKASHVAADAVVLETAIQAMEYKHKASPLIQEFVDNAKAQLKTESGKKLFAEAEKGEAKHWWKGLLKRGI